MFCRKISTVVVLVCQDIRIKSVVVEFGQLRKGLSDLNTHASGPKYTRVRRQSMKKLEPAPVVYPCDLCKKREATIFKQATRECFCTGCYEYIHDI